MYLYLSISIYLYLSIYLSRRELANVLEVSGDEQFRSTILRARARAPELSMRARVHDQCTQAQTRTRYQIRDEESQGKRVMVLENEFRHRSIRVVAGPLCKLGITRQR